MNILIDHKIKERFGEGEGYWLKLSLINKLKSQLKPY